MIISVPVERSFKGHCSRPTALSYAINNYGATMKWFHEYQIDEIFKICLIWLQLTSEKCMAHSDIHEPWELRSDMYNNKNNKKRANKLFWYLLCIYHYMIGSIMDT